MDELILKFTMLRKKLYEDSLKPNVKDTFIGQMHLQSITDELTVLGKFLERCGVDIEELNKDFKSKGY
jgi:hypothetical protein